MCYQRVSPSVARKQVATRLDDKTIKAFEDYVDSEETPDKKNADAFRRFVREGLAKRDYPVAVADGGAFQIEDEINELKTRQARATRTQTAAILSGLGYIALTLQYNLDAVFSIILGVIVLALLLVVQFWERIV